MKTEETPICLGLSRRSSAKTEEATSEVRALFKTVFILTSLSAFASSFLRQKIGVRCAANRFEIESSSNVFKTKKVSKYFVA